VAQVDFLYAKKKRFDTERGVLRKCWLFVMTLGFSRRMFCDLVFDQKVGTWLQLHIRAFEFFGGVLRVLVPDNLNGGPSTVVLQLLDARENPWPLPCIRCVGMLPDALRWVRMRSVDRSVCTRYSA
jgi:transposase